MVPIPARCLRLPFTIPRRTSTYQVLGEKLAFYRIFAETPPTEEGIISFANKYGMLGEFISITSPDIPPTPVEIEHGIKVGVGRGEPISLWIDEIKAMKAAVTFWDIIKGNDQDGLARAVHWNDDGATYTLTDTVGNIYYEGSILWLPPLSLRKKWKREWKWSSPEKTVTWKPSYGPMPLAWYALEGFINEHLAKRLSPRFQVNQKRDKFYPSLYFVPSSLIGALWFDFALTTTEGLDYRRCSYCGKPFVLSPDKARINRQYCSDSCKTMAWRKKNKETARMDEHRARSSTNRKTA